MAHYPVLLKEVLQYVGAEQGVKFIDATIGSAGHTKAILKLNPKAKVLGLDWDKESLEKLPKEIDQVNVSRIKFAHSNYRNIKTVALENGFESVDGIILDLGFSSLQLDDDNRGFSFQNAGPLDMRYDRTQHLDAARVINTYSEKELSEIFKKYGEEPNAKKIARELVVYRKNSVFSTTDQVFSVIKEALPKPIRFKAADAARRIFQAIRIEVNTELENLQKALPDMIELLSPNGRLVVISFQSLEDRIVKTFFNSLSKGCICPPEFPQCVCGKQPIARVLTKKPITATEEELSENARSKPAKLRAIEKI